MPENHNGLCRNIRIIGINNSKGLFVPCLFYDIMSAKEKEAAAKQTFTFLAPLTSEQSCEAGRKSAKARVRECRVDKE